MVTLLLLLACADGEMALPDPPETGDSAEDTASDTASDTADSGDTTDSVDTGPWDADGDGFFGAEDCDDADPDVYPGAPDWCDAQDQACDGDPVGEGMCGEIGDLDAVAATEWWGPPELQPLISTTWATSVGERIGGVVHCPDEEGLLRGVNCVAFYPGGEGEVGFDEAQVWVRDRTYSLYSAQVIGDFDGDGWDDVATGGGDTSGTYVGSVFLLSGDASTWAGSADGYLPDTSMAWWQQDWGDFGTWVAGGGDVNDDGLADVFVHAPLEMDDGDLNGGLYLMLGRTDGLPRGEEPTDELFFDHPRTWGDALDDQLDTYTFVHDVDGDGADDLLAQVAFEDWRYGVASGETLLASDGAPLEEVFTMSEPFTGIGWGTSSIEGGVGLGDRDADGIDDMLANLRYDLGQDGVTDDDPLCIGVVSGAAVGGLVSPWDIVLTELCEDDEAVIGGILETSVADVDHDGLRDALVSVTSDHAPNQVCLLASSRFPTSGRGDLMDALGPCYAGDGNVIGEAAVADLTGDGVSELHVRYEDRRGDGLDSILSLDGFLVPWDDASKW